MDKVRVAALLCIYDVEYNGAYSNAALKKAINENKFSGRDASFLTTLVYGVVKRKITLDYIIEKHSKIKMKKISKYILQILRLGIYQIYFADRIPDSAAADECVKLAKRYGHKASSGFVNGVLRNAAKDKNIVYPEEPAEYLSVKYSYPLAAAKRWIGEFGFEFAEKIMAAQSEDAHITLRVNRLLSDCDTVIEELKKTGVQAQICAEHFIRADGFDIASSRMYRDGVITAQDISASYPAQALSPKPGESVLDMCAAPGGKTTLCAEMMNNTGNITACDIHTHKIEIIQKNAKRMKIDIINARKSDAEVFCKEFEGRFDKVLADVPCSGSGIIKRKPDIKYKEDAVYDMQYRILENAAKYIKPDGRLVYSTCSIEKAENEDVTDRFLKENPEYEYDDISKVFPERTRAGEIKNKGCMTVYPTGGSDGFFICMIKLRI